tara:strand:- start:123 stop:380 length:258 start_codon:yes stop_codon:yes gene_type:complete
MTTTYNVPTTKDSETLEDHLWMESGNYASNTAGEVVTFMWQDHFDVADTNEQGWALQDMAKYYEGVQDGLDPAFAEEQALCDIPF